MVNKPLLSGIAGFILGGLLVSIAATTFAKPDSTPRQNSSMNSMSMEQMTASLTNLNGDAYDKAFISNMIEHHQAAVNMANLSNSRAKHAEIKKLSQNIITAQEQEITEMKQWQKDWGYGSGASMDMSGIDRTSH